MHYRVRRKLIATELAAKPPSQASAHLLAFLKGYKQVQHAPDYGCGKLRYASALATTADSLTLVDSFEQLDRQPIEAIDEDIRVERLLAWKPSAESQASFKEWLSQRSLA